MIGGVFKHAPRRVRHRATGFEDVAHNLDATETSGLEFLRYLGFELGSFSAGVFLDAGAAIPNHTLFSFHRPRLKRAALMTA